MEWQPIETRPHGYNLTYLVVNKKGHVAAWIRGVIHNTAGTPSDWGNGDGITHWMPLPEPPNAALSGSHWRKT